MRWHRVLGAVLVLLGLIGFAAVADDLRHSGEIWGVGTILVAGLVLLAAGSQRPLRSRLAIQWVSLGMLAGAVLGAGLDNMPLGVGLGTAVGVLAAVFLVKKHS